jgi:prephenate dehydratase
MRSVTIPAAPAPAVRVAFQGALGAFGDEAATLFSKGRATLLPKREFLDVAHSVETGEVDYGLLPIENTLTGSVVDSYDALVACERVHAVAEVVLPIHHCLLAPAGATMSGLRTVESHPVALAQCRAFLRRHPHLEVRAAYNTAGAARDVALRGDPTAAAIAGHAAGTRYGLEILEDNIEDRPDNQTRFLAIGSNPGLLAEGSPVRTTLLVTVENVTGALLSVLQPLVDNAINLSKLESRPTSVPWSYRFFLDMEHPALHPLATAAIEQVRTTAQSLRVLGTYPRWEVATGD